jgi:predicted metal-dependent hydrolase
MKHTHSGETIHFDLKIKNRRSIGIYLDSYGNIEVHAPKGTLKETVTRLLEDNWDTIHSKSEAVKERLNGPQMKTFQNGEPFLFLGRSFPIELHHNYEITHDHVTFNGDRLNIHVKELEDERIKQALKRFYYKKCKSIVEKSISIHQSHFKTKPRSVRISDSQTTWGTCDGRRQLTFNWRLAMAPQDVIDYVVVHEMCHMSHLNHDRSFWRLVGKIVPDYKKKEQWLARTSWKMTV